MKKLVSSICLFCLCCSLKAQSGIVNSGFENWYDDQPVSWTTSLSGNVLVTVPILGQIPYPVSVNFGTQSPDAQEGNYALKLQAKNVGVSGTPYEYTFPGIAQLGIAREFNIPLDTLRDLSSALNFGDPSSLTSLSALLASGDSCSKTPMNLNMWIKYLPAGNDTLSVIAYTKENGIFVSFASYRTSDIISDYTQINVPFSNPLANCDSIGIVILSGGFNTHLATELYVDNLTLNYFTGNEFQIDTCDSYTWAGETYTQSCDTTRTFPNAAGGDSTVTLHLTIRNSSPPTMFEISTCDHYEWAGETYTQSCDTTRTFPNAAGCDSIVTLHLTIWPLPDVTITADTDAILMGTSLILTASGANSYLWNTGETTSQITVTPQVSTVYIVEGTDHNGCSNNDTILISVVGIDAYDAQFILYPNPATACVYIKGHDMRTLYLYDDCGRLLLIRKPDSNSFTELPLDYYADGRYVVKILLRNGKMITQKIIVKKR